MAEEHRVRGVILHELIDALGYHLPDRPQILTQGVENLTNNNENNRRTRRCKDSVFFEACFISRAMLYRVAVAQLCAKFRKTFGL